MSGFYRIYNFQSRRRPYKNPKFANKPSDMHIPQQVSVWLLFFHSTLTLVHCAYETRLNFFENAEAIDFHKNKFWVYSTKNVVQCRLNAQKISSTWVLYVFYWVKFSKIPAPSKFLDRCKLCFVKSLSMSFHSHVLAIRHEKIHVGKLVFFVPPRRSVNITDGASFNLNPLYNPIPCKPEMEKALFIRKTKKFKKTLYDWYLVHTSFS